MSEAIVVPTTGASGGTSVLDCSFSGYHHWTQSPSLSNTVKSPTPFSFVALMFLKDMYPTPSPEPAYIKAYMPGDSLFLAKNMSDFILYNDTFLYIRVSTTDNSITLRTSISSGTAGNFSFHGVVMFIP